MIRRSAKTTAVTLMDVNRWHAAEWKRIRDFLLIEASVVTVPLTRSVIVRVARRANHEFIRYMREVRAS